MSNYTNTLSSLSSSSNGLSGLVSGMDTESMVTKLLSPTKLKIQQQENLRQQLLWKQSNLRSDITLLKNFQLKFMSFTSPETNLLSSNFFHQMSANSSSSAISAIATGKAIKGTMVINNIEKLATSAVVKSNVPVTGILQGTIDESLLASLGDKSTVIFNLDGVQKEIRLNAKGSDGSVSAQNLALNLKDSLSSAFGSAVSLSFENGKISITTNSNEGRQISLGVSKDGGSSALSVLGMKDGMSNKLNYGVALKDLNFAKNLVGSQFKFKINGTEISVNSDETLGNFINTVNKSDAGVTLSYSSLTDTFSLTRNETGAGLGITFEQETGNLLDILFSAGEATSVMGNAFRQESVTGTGAYDSAFLSNLLGGSFSFHLNGQAKSVSALPKADGTKYTEAELVSEFNKLLKASFGEDKEGSANIKIIRQGESGAYTVKSAEGYNVSFDESDVQSITKAMGFEAGQTQAANSGTSLSSLGLNTGTINFKNAAGTSVSLDLSKIVNGTNPSEEATLNDLTDAINKSIVTDLGISGAGVSIDASTGAITISGIPQQEGKSTLTIEGDAAAMDKIFGSSTISMGNSAFNNSYTEGTNAVLTVNGVRIERNNNHFNVDGVDLSLKQTSDTPINIEVTQNTDNVLKGIKNFVEEYNKLIDTLNTQVHEEATYRKYDPLTKEQEGEMSENEIEEWNKKAKAGLLRNDTALNTILSQMRSAFYQKPEGAKFALYEIGITTSSNYKDYGKLIINDESKLKAAIENDSGELMKLFTDNSSGIAKKINTIVDESTKAGYKGTTSLYYKAGGLTTSTNDTSTVIGREIYDREKKISDLKMIYDSQYNRYWKQFNSMEQLIQQMNSQSAWLAQQFS